MTVSDEWIQFEAPGGALNGYIAKPKGSPPWPGLIILHPVTGVTPHVSELTQSFAAEGYLAFAPDLYTNDPQYKDHQTADINSAAHMGPNATGWDTHLAKFQEPQRGRVLAARQWISGRPQGGYITLVRAAYDYLRARNDVGLIGSIGYCMGGRLTAALAALGVELAAGVIYYGGGPKEDEVANVRCPLEGHYAVTDRGITGKVYEFALAMKAARKHFAYSVYDADHGFNDPSSPHAYNAEAARLARERSNEFLSKHLKAALAVAG